MKKCSCSATVENELQQKNLCDCIKILGGKPVQYGTTISVQYEGEKADTMIDLFSNFVDHSIEASSQKGA